MVLEATYMQEQQIFCQSGVHRTEEEKKRLKKRLNIVVGQINGIIKSIDEDKSCDDLLINALATSNALKSFGNEVLRDHIKNCPRDGNNIDSFDNLLSLFLKLNI